LYEITSTVVVPSSKIILRALVIIEAGIRRRQRVLVRNRDDRGTDLVILLPC